ncbi:MAG: hypothetical protein RL026_495 [Pseudomonadota bacterium]|jgi:putative endonuclease
MVDAPHLLRGAAAEEAASRHLEAAGLVVIRRNYRCRMGELDVVAREGGQVLVVAEVRCRSRTDHGGAAASVDFRKQRRLQRTTLHLLQADRSLARLRVRFDVIEAVPEGTAWRLNWIRGAFSA